MSSTIKLRIGKFMPSGELEAGSMALAIETEMVKATPYAAGENKRARRKFALAIATAVVQHLCDNAAAFMTTVPDTSGSTHEQPASKIDKW